MKTLKVLTLALLFRGDKILLAMKKRRFGVGKWNGYGGKLEKNEKPLDAIVREIKEESGLEIDKKLYKELGKIDFIFDHKPELDQRVIIYRIDDFVGEPIETEEMMPKWFDIKEIPYDKMWVSDVEWMPYMLSSKKFKGEIHFFGDGERVVNCVLE